MDLPDFSAGRSPRRELQGPRPAPLKVRKESHKIKKPPVVPQQQQPPHPHQHQQTQQPRPPVIIYTVSPKVIHTNPNEFMNLVQRLTGCSSTSTSYTTVPGTPYSPASAFHDDGGAISPAARFASIERTRSPEGGKRNKLGSAAVLPEAEMVEEMGGGGIVGDRNGFILGILSPGPGSLPPIPPNLFSPPLINDHQNQNPLNFLHDLSPNLHSNRNFSMSPMMFGESSIFMPSPSNLLSSHIVSPTHQFDLFNSLFDF